jgi:hypothetical protein
LKNTIEGISDFLNGVWKGSLGGLECHPLATLGMSLEIENSTKLQMGCEKHVTRTRLTLKNGQSINIGGMNNIIDIYFSLISGDPPHQVRQKVISEAGKEPSPIIPLDQTCIYQSLEDSPLSKHYQISKKEVVSITWECLYLGVEGHK